MCKNQTDNKGKHYEHAETKNTLENSGIRKFRFYATDILSKWTKPALKTITLES